jgi:hypothetical protein
MTRQKDSALIDVIGLLGIAAFFVVILLFAVQLIRADTTAYTSKEGSPLRTAPAIVQEVQSASLTAPASAE